MVRCSFTRKNIEPGTGKMYVKKDGTILWFISHKAQMNYLKLEREARFLKWTGAYKKGAAPNTKEALPTRAGDK
jgi:large subunit ribosomal protein L24e